MRECLKDAGGTKEAIQVWKRAAEGHLEQKEEELCSAGEQLPGAKGWPARPWGGLNGRQAGHTDCSTNRRITGIVTPTQPP